MSILMLVPILLPLLVGITLFLLRSHNSKIRNAFILTAVIINSAITLAVICTTDGGSLTLLRVTDDISLVLQIDGLGKVFACLLAVLWPFATLYAFEYMEHYHGLNMFFAFYTITFGVTLGVAFSGNILTMYLFYEFLTLVTTPLVLHIQNRESVKAARKYLVYSITGAAIGFIAVVFVLVYGQNATFTFGGIIDPSLGNFDENMMRFIYVLSFVGFGVKAAIFPMHGWLLSASVAPTPVTALLHAVAVVKTGVFLIMRSTYYVFGTDLIANSWAQTVVMSIAAITVVYASFKATKENHLKRRLAYSTMSNLSYILLGVTLMTSFGLYAALIHMVFHAVMKICAFSCAGAILEKADLHYVNELEGMGKVMPFIFTAFTASSLSLMGMPFFIGFFSKFNLISAAIDRGGNLAVLMIVTLFLASILTVVYLILIVIRAFFPRDGITPREGRDPGFRMKLPIGTFAVLSVFGGFFAEPLFDFLDKVSKGLV